MKKLIAMMMLAGIMIGCSQPPKGKIEQRFDRYLQETLADPTDCKEVRSIELSDSIDFYKLSTDILDNYNKSDSLRSAFISKVSALPKSELAKLGRLNMAQAEKYRRSIVQMMTKIAECEAPNAKHELQGIVDSIPAERLKVRTYVLKAHMRGNAELVPYYISDFATDDTIFVTKDSFKVGDIPENAARMRDLIGILMNASADNIDMIKDVKDMLKSVGVAGL